MMATNRRRYSRPAVDDHVEDALEVELDVTNVAHGGVFVARHDGRVVFVADTLPGERVLARVSDTRHTSFWRAETLRVLQAAPERREHVWREASVDRAPTERAGGAEFGHIIDEHQRELKRQVLADALQRFGGISTDAVVEEIGGEATGWRTRVRLQISRDGVVGPYAARSHHVVAVDSLPLASDAAAAIAPLGERHPHAASIDVVAPSDDAPRLLVAERDGRGRASTAAGSHAVVHERVGDRRFAVDAGGFWQVHRGAATTLTSAVQDAVDADLFDARAANLDLYGGVGLLAAAIGDRFGSATRVTSVESDERATEHAGANLAEWLGAAVITARVDRYLAELVSTASASDRRRLEAATVVLDPPRSGAGRPVIDSLAELAPRQLVYVACDPVALARDTGLLRGRGYELTGLRAFDLFPNTHHLEAVAGFTRR
ncbi:class I SAM-dependent RNA methyltransferase [Glaciibacter flavus]|uniref:class I SAM-dependent RNA methyltransferase n=1 Tax=Orlajensenia flava TaxID=2565934 RepID=UPI003AFF7EE2